MTLECGLCKMNKNVYFVTPRKVAYKTEQENSPKSVKAYKAKDSERYNKKNKTTSPGG